LRNLWTEEAGKKGTRSRHGEIAALNIQAQRTFERGTLGLRLRERTGKFDPRNELV